MSHEKDFDVSVTHEIIQASYPNDMSGYAIVNAFKQTFPDLINEQSIGIEDDTLFWKKIDNDSKTVFGIPVCDVINFDFVMDTKLYDWMQAFDNGEQVNPIDIQAIIESHEFCTRFAVNYFSGWMSIMA